MFFIEGEHFGVYTNKSRLIKDKHLADFLSEINGFFALALGRFSFLVYNK